MADLGWTPVTLPSCGVLYPDPEGDESLIPDGTVQIRKLTTNEESILLSQGAGGIERLDIVLKNCTRLPESFTKARQKHEDLLMTDRMALMLAIRTLTFGPNYTFTFRCRECGETGKAHIDIMEDLNENTPDTIRRKLRDRGDDVSEDFVPTEPVTVELPDDGATLELRFLRGRDETRVMKHAKQMRLQSNDRTDDSYVYRLALQIVSIDGEERKLHDCIDFVSKLSALDSGKMRVALDSYEPAIDMRIYPDCRACGATNEMVMPFTAEFFRPTDL